MTQHERIIEYMRTFGSISPMDAFTELGITKLSTRIGELVRQGYPIENTWEYGKNRFGQKVFYKRYTLKEE